MGVLVVVVWIRHRLPSIVCTSRRGAGGLKEADVRSQCAAIVGLWLRHGQIRDLCRQWLDREVLERVGGRCVDSPTESDMTPTAPSANSLPCRQSPVKYFFWSTISRSHRDVSVEDYVRRRRKVESRVRYREVLRNGERFGEVGRFRRSLTMSLGFRDVIKYSWVHR